MRLSCVHEESRSGKLPRVRRLSALPSITGVLLHGRELTKLRTDKMGHFLPCAPQQKIARSPRGATKQRDRNREAERLSRAQNKKGAC
jgi:hypothetical protein